MITIFHNPDCGTSRNTLAIIRATGVEPEVVEYLLTGWTREQLLTLFGDAGITPRNALRVARSPAESLGLTDESVDDDILLDAMISHPILVNRPIVRTPKGTRLCRPCELVLDLLEPWQSGEFRKENGELLIDADGELIQPD